MCFKFAIKLLILCSFRMTFTKKKSTDDNEKTSIVCYRPLTVVLFFSFKKQVNEIKKNTIKFNTIDIFLYFGNITNI